MANLKNIADLPLSDNSQNLGFIVNDNGQAKQLKENFATQQDIENIEQIISTTQKTVIISPSQAKIGQVLKVQEVDENGKPSKWECVYLEPIYYIVTDAANGAPTTETMARYVTPGCYQAAYNACVNRTPFMLFASHFYGVETSKHPYYLCLYDMEINDDETINLIFNNGFYGQLYQDDTARLWYHE